MIRNSVVIAVGLALQTLGAQAPAAKPLPQRLADDFITLAGGVHTGYRINHAKGIVLTGTFTPSKGAAAVSKASFLAAASTPVIVRYSDATGVPTIPDNNPNASPRGIAVRFSLPGGAYHDIVANSHNGFPVGNGEDFDAFLKSVIATDQKAPHPWPVEKFLGTHPAALKFATDKKPMPVSFATESWFANNALIFVNAQGVKQAGRYRLVPVEGNHYLDSAAEAKTSPNYLFDELPKHVAKGPYRVRLMLQLANPGDQTADGSIVWPEDRKLVELGVITITTVAPNNAELQKSLAFSPIYLTDGITLSDDPLPLLRAQVYAISVTHRR